MKKIGVIGAGTMGQGIANSFASNGYDVTVCDIKLEWAQGGIDKIAKKLLGLLIFLLLKIHYKFYLMFYKIYQSPYFL